MMITQANDIGCFRKSFERLPKQFVRETCHWHVSALSFHIQQMNNVVR